MRKLLVALGSAGLALAAQSGFAVNGDHPILQPRPYDAGKPNVGRSFDERSSTGASTTAPREDSMGRPEEYKDRERSYMPERMRSRDERRLGDRPSSDRFFQFMDSGIPRG